MSSGVRTGPLRVAEAATELGLGRTSCAELAASYLAAAERRRAHLWSPAASGGNHRPPLTAAGTATLRKLLGSAPPCSDSFTASDLLRRHDKALARAHGFPRALDVNDHSGFFTSTPDALTQLGTARRFYEGPSAPPPLPWPKEKSSAPMTSDNNASRPSSPPSPAPPSLRDCVKSRSARETRERTRNHGAGCAPFAAFGVFRGPTFCLPEPFYTASEANALLGKLRLHHNAREHHRELRSTPQAAWVPALREKRSARLRIERPGGSTVTRGLPTNGDASGHLHPPAHGHLPILLRHLPQPKSTVPL